MSGQRWLERSKMFGHHIQFKEPQMNETKEVSGLEAAVNTALVQIPLPVENWDDVPVTYDKQHELKLKAYAEEVAALPAIVDAKSYDVNQKQRTKLIGVRTGLDKYRKDVFAPMRALKETFDAYIGTTPDSGLQAKVKALEQQIEAKQRVWDDAQEEIRRKAQALIQERNQKRAQTLMDMLFAYDGLVYRLGDIVKMDTDLRTEPDAAFDRFVLTSKPESERQKRKHARIEELKAAGYEPTTISVGEGMVLQHDGGSTMEIPTVHLCDMPDEAFADFVDMGRKELARRAEVKRLEAEQNERNRLAFEEQGRKQKQMDEDRAALDREKAKLREERKDMRRTELERLGMWYDPIGGMKVLVKPGVPGADIGDECLVYDLGQIADMDAEQWSVLKESVSRIVEETNRQIKERKAKNALMDSRSDVLQELGAKYDGDSVWTLGSETTTDTLLANMDDATWQLVRGAFYDQQNIAVVASLAPVQVIDEEELPVSTYPPVTFDEALADARAKVIAHDEVYMLPLTEEIKSTLRAADVACFNFVRWYGDQIVRK